MESLSAGANYAQHCFMSSMGLGTPEREPEASLALPAALALLPVICNGVEAIEVDEIDGVLSFANVCNVG